MKFNVTLELKVAKTYDDGSDVEEVSPELALAIVRDMLDVDKDTDFIMDWGEYVSMISQDLHNQLPPNTFLDVEVTNVEPV